FSPAVSLSNPAIGRVQKLGIRARGNRMRAPGPGSFNHTGVLLRTLGRALGTAFLLLCVLPSPGAGQTPATSSSQTRLVWPDPPESPRIEFEHSYSRAADFGWKRSLWRKFADWAKNETDPSILQRPFATAVDAEGRLIVADLGGPDVKVFDPRKKSLKILRGYDNIHFLAPVSVAVDDAQNIYVSDSAAGRVLKFSHQGDFLAYIGGPEGAFKRPAAVAFHKGNHLIYVVDTLRP